MPPSAYLVAYADDVAVIIRARDSDAAQSILTEEMMPVVRWMQLRGLDLALQKTEVVILTGRRVPTIIPVTMGDVEMQT